MQEGFGANFGADPESEGEEWLDWADLKKKQQGVQHDEL